MNKFRKIETVLALPPSHMVGDGFKVHNFFPRYGDKRMSPFFLLDYNPEYYFPPSDKPRGVGAHPHRGIETVTIAYQGKIAHHDSKGNGGVIGEGDVQWMTAGSGLLHNEYHEKEFSLKGGNMQMVQLWVNLRKKDKMTSPAYQSIENRHLGKYILEDEKGQVEVISGSFKGVAGPAKSFIPIDLFNISLNKGSLIDFSLPEHHNTGLLVIKGEIRINDNTDVEESSFVLFENLNESIQLEASDNCKVLLMSGEPIDEPLVSRGPFLMNTIEEIKEAYEDYYNGLFGYLED